MTPATRWGALLRDVAAERFPWRGGWPLFVSDVIACLDDSGLHRSPKWLGLCGYLGGARKWKRFDKAWNAALRKKDVLDFHSKDFFAADKGGKYRLYSNPDVERLYGDWSKDELDKFLADLLWVIGRRDVVPFGAMVELGAFRALSYGERRFMTGGVIDRDGWKWISSGAPKSPYFLLFNRVLPDAGRLTSATKKILYVFDRQQQYEGGARSQFTRFVNGRWVLPEIREKLGGIVFAQRSEVCGLQGADLYVHCWHRYMTDRASLVGRRRKAMDKLAARDPMQSYDAAALEEFLDKNLRADERAWLREQEERKQPKRVKSPWPREET